jgi:hypothetical protein
MKTSSLAACFEDFAPTIVAVDAPQEKTPRMVAMENSAAPRPARGRLSFDSRRILIRDTGLRHFRVF